MNFDDLHDPSPRPPSASTLAAVATRARSLRRRRTVLTSVGGAVAVAVIALPVGLALRDDGADIVTIDTSPATTVEPEPSVTVTASTAPSPTATPSTEGLPDREPLATAVTEAGGGVVVYPDGAVTVLKMADPPLPDGLEVRTVLVPPTRPQRSFVGLCCLPVSTPDEESARWGEFMAGELDRPGQVRAMDAAGTALAVLGVDGVAVVALDGEELAASTRPVGESTVVDVAFLPDGRLAVIDLHADDEVGFVGRLHVTDGQLSTLAESAGTILGPVEGNGTWQLAGTDASANVLVTAGGDGAYNGHPRAFDLGTLAEVARSPSTGVESVRDVWFEASVATWVDIDGALWHDGAVISAGPFRHARPATSTSEAPEVPIATTTSPSTIPSERVVGFTTIRADGDAEVVYPGDYSSVVREGSDAAAVDSFVVGSGGRMFVSTCCDTGVAGWSEIAVGDEPSHSGVRPGHGLAVSPDGTRLLTFSVQDVRVHDLDGAVLAAAASDPGDGTSRELLDAAWVDDESIAVLAYRPGDGDGSSFQLTVGAPSAINFATGATVDVAPPDERTLPALAGSSADGSIVTATGAAFDPVTLARRPGSDVAMPPGSLDVWVDRGVVTSVDAAGALWHDGERVADGPYTWARPIPG